MGRITHLARALVFLLPASALKNRLLSMSGLDVSASARIAPCIVWGVSAMMVGDRAVIGPFNVFRGLASVIIEEESIIGQLNWIWAQPEFSALGGMYGTLHMQRCSTIVSRHHLDCSGGIVLGEFSLVAGMQTIFISHQVDRSTATLEAATIRVGAYTLVNACNRLSPGSVVPARCVTGMGAVVVPGLSQEGKLYAGMPACAKSDIDVRGKFFTRSEAAFGVAGVASDVEVPVRRAA